MIKRLVGIVCCVFALCAFAQEVQTLPTVTVTAKRPLKDIGIEKTVIDSAALRDNIALTMANILTYNSSVFVKSYGRASLSTVAFRGTSPSHTQVTWNGMRLNSPMLGMTDFSTIPAYFIDGAALLHGTSSVNETGGGLGGLVKLATTPDIPEGIHVQYVQGVGSFSTFDEFGRVAWANDRWATSTRVVYSSSPNDYKYVNHDKMEVVYDEDHNIVDRYHPTERNRNASYNDFNLLQEVYYNTLGGDSFGFNAWYTGSNRELPMLTTDYGLTSEFENRQREYTFRGILSWLHTRSRWSTDFRAGYTGTYLAYDYKRDVGGAGGMATMTRSRSHVNMVYAQGEGTWYSHDRRLMLSANLAAYQNMVRSADRNIVTTEGTNATVGYDKNRLELSGAATARWQPVDRLGMSLVLREEAYGSTWTPIIPALFIDALLTPVGNITAKASVSRNYHCPSLNDLYFLPGGNPDLRPEKGISYDFGLSATFGKHHPLGGGLVGAGSVTWFDSYIDDWILWLPTTKGFFSPRNVKKVHAYGIEGAADVAWSFAKGWLLDLGASISWTPSINRGEPMTAADKSVGKQLPYVPKCSASINGRLTYSRFSFAYKWAYYSRRYTQSSNETTLSGQLPRYYMSNITLGYRQPTRWVDFDFKLAVNNLFDEDYLSVLSRPMPGRNFEFFISITPKFNR